MNVPQTMVGVPTHAPTRRDPLHAAAELAMDLVVMERVAMVSRFIEWDMYRLASPGYFVEA